VIERTNVRYPVGEIDILAREGQTLCFVEVRSVSSDAFGGAAASVTLEKQRRIIRAAQWYLARRPAPASARFDVVTVDWIGGRACLDLIRGAFDLPY
jgi:putative endonuclease